MSILNLLFTSIMYIFLVNHTKTSLFRAIDLSFVSKNIRPPLLRSVHDGRQSRFGAIIIDHRVWLSARAHEAGHSLLPLHPTIACLPLAPGIPGRIRRPRTGNWRAYRRSDCRRQSRGSSAVSEHLIAPLACACPAAAYGQARPVLPPGRCEAVSYGWVWCPLAPEDAPAAVAGPTMFRRQLAQPYTFLQTSAVSTDRSSHRQGDHIFL